MTVLGDLLERADPDCLSPAGEAELLRDAPWRRLVVLGDSVASGVREPVDGYLDQCFADRVAAALRSGRPGAGDRDPGDRDYGDRDLDDRDYRNLAAPWACLPDVRAEQLPTALRAVPDLALVVAGGNDALRESYTRDRLWRGLLDVLGPLADVGALVVTVGLFDVARSGLRPARFSAELTERFDELDLVTAAATAQVGGVHVDTHHHRRAADPAIFAADRLHANAAGHAIASAAIVRALAARLDTRRPPIPADPDTS